jgi:PncC family amidohydrolase
MLSKPDDGHLPSDGLARGLGRLLKVHGLRIATAESCTGGRIATCLTALPGAADFFAGGVITYSTGATTSLLGVSPSLLQHEGSVSAHTASEMARRVRHRLGAEVGLGVTGVVGEPLEGKPPGLVFAAISLDDFLEVSQRHGDKGPEGNLAAAVRLGLRGSIETLVRWALTRG